MFSPVGGSSVTDGLLSVIGDPKKVKEHLEEIKKAQKEAEVALEALNKARKALDEKQGEAADLESNLVLREKEVADKKRALDVREAKLLVDQGKLSQDRLDFDKRIRALIEEEKRVNNLGVNIDERDRAMKVKEAELALEWKNLEKKKNEFIDRERALKAKEDTFEQKLKAVGLVASV